MLLLTVLSFFLLFCESHSADSVCHQRLESASSLNPDLDTMTVTLPSAAVCLVPAGEFLRASSSNSSNNSSSSRAVTAALALFF
jgi:hypothetical protein